MKNIIISTRSLSSLILICVVALFFSACSSESKKSSSEEETNVEEVEVEEMDEHAGHDHSSHEGHDHGDDMESMETLDNNLNFEAGSWSADILQFMSTGSGSKTFVLDKVPFEGDEVSVEGNQQLDDLAALLKAFPDITATIQGHTKEANNAVGKTTNKATSKARALWVQTKLSLRGVSGKQMKARGLGDDELLSDVPGDDDRQKRIEVVLNK